MKHDQIFTGWCIASVPTIIGHTVMDCEEDGGSFFLGAKTTLFIRGAEGVGFQLPLPDNIVDINNPENVSKQGLDLWIKIVTGTIFKVWDGSYNKKKIKLLDDLKSFSILYPKMAADLLGAVIFKDGVFQFNLQKKAYGEISLMAAKFDEFVKKRDGNQPPPKIIT